MSATFQRCESDSTPSDQLATQSRCAPNVVIDSYIEVVLNTLPIDTSLCSLSSN